MDLEAFIYFVSIVAGFVFMSVLLAFDIKETDMKTDCLEKGFYQVSKSVFIECKTIDLEKQYLNNIGERK